MIFDLMFIIGFGLVTTGLWFITPIASALFAGVVLMAIGIKGSLNGISRKDS